MMRCPLLGILAAILLPACGRSVSPIDFADKHLEDAVRHELHLSQSETISSNEGLKLKVLKARNEAIQDISGIEQLGNLEVLDLSNFVFTTTDMPSNTVGSLDPLQSLTALKSFNFDRAYVGPTLKALAPLKLLEEIRCERCGLSSVNDLASLPKLREIRVARNQLSELPANWDTTELALIDLRFNELSDPAQLDSLFNLADDRESPLEVYLGGNKFPGEHFQLLRKKDDEISGIEIFWQMYPWH